MDELGCRGSGRAGFVSSRYGERGFPDVAGDAIPFAWRLADAAKDIPLFLTADGADEVSAVVKRPAGGAYDPQRDAAGRRGADDRFAATPASSLQSLRTIWSPAAGPGWRAGGRSRSATGATAARSVRPAQSLDLTKPGSTPSGLLRGGAGQRFRAVRSVRDDLSLRRRDGQGTREDLVNPVRLVRARREMCVDCRRRRDPSGPANLATCASKRSGSRPSSCRTCAVGRGCADVGTSTISAVRSELR